VKAQYKIVFSGPVGAGKTTAITAISDRPPISTEQKATDETAKLKKTTTVAMDYGSIRLPDGNLINLYGTPGQQRFDFMWDILSDGAIGLVIIVDHSATDPLTDLTTYVDAFREDFGQHNIVVGINKFRHGKGPTLEDYHRSLLARDVNSPVMEIDARDKSDVATLLQGLLFNIDPSLQSV
jgi:uncharacterized protein